MKLPLIFVFLFLSTVILAGEIAVAFSGQSNCLLLPARRWMLPQIEAVYPGTELVKFASIGESIEKWSIGNWVPRCLDRIQGTPDVVVWAFMQGERDAKMGMASFTYELHLGMVLDNVEAYCAARWPGCEVRHVIGRISDGPLPRQGWVGVRAAQESVAAARGALVDTDGLGFVHFFGNYDVLGERFADAILGEIMAVGG